MKKCLKWDYDKQDYYLASISENCILHSNNKHDKTQCANCNKWLEIGDSFTSHQYQTGLGFGYPICEECYKKEWEKRYNEKYRS